MTQVSVLDIAIFDAPDIEKAGRFYAELTGWDVVRQDDERFGVRAPNGQEIEFQRAPDHLAPQWPGQERPQQFHLDLQVADLRRRSSGRSASAPPSCATVPPGSPWPTRPATRSTCARRTASGR